MELHEKEGAVKFDSRKECQEWIDERVVRFKLRMVKAATATPGEYTFVPQKCDGQIVHTKTEDFKKSATDEPLKNYASPLKDDGKWLAVMKVH
jgi:hypothetical protein